MLSNPQLVALADEGGWTEETAAILLERYLEDRGLVEDAAGYLSGVLDREQSHGARGSEP